MDEKNFLHFTDQKNGKLNDDDDNDDDKLYYRK